MYQYTKDNEFVIDIDTGALIARGTYLWPSDESTIAPYVQSELDFYDYASMVSYGVGKWMDDYVRDNFKYDNIVSCISYLEDKNSIYALQASAAKAWRSDVYTALYAAVPSYSAMTPDQWPTLDYITAHLPQPSAYQWEPANDS